MRITIVQDYFRMGGTERQTLFLAKRFQAAGHEVDLLIFRPGGTLYEQVKSSGLRLHVLQPFDTGVCLLAPGLMEAVEHLFPDLVLCMGRTANCYSGFIQRRFPKVAVVGTLRTGKVVFPLHHWSVGQVRAVLVNSNWWKRRLLERAFPVERIHVIHNALLLNIDEKERQRLRSKIRTQMGAGPDTTVFLNVSTFRPGKRHMDLLQIFKKLHERNHTDWQLWLVGEGVELKRCKRFVEEAGMSDRVTFFGQHQDPLPYYSGADVAVSASREDSLPNFLIEAQASGLPLVAYDCRGVIECCEPNKTGIVLPPDQPDTFSDLLSRIARDKPWRDQLASGASAFALSRFSTANQADQTLKFLQRIAHDDHPRLAEEPVAS